MKLGVVMTGAAALLLAVAPVARGATVGSPDRWFAPDKLKHFFMSAFVQSVTYGALRATDLGHRSSLIGASVVTVALGAGKELHDRHSAGDFSARDLAWDLMGGGAATLLLDRTRH